MPPVHRRPRSVGAMPIGYFPCLGVPRSRLIPAEILADSRDVGPVHHWHNGSIFDQQIIHLDKQLPPQLRIYFRLRFFIEGVIVWIAVTTEIQARPTV